MKNTSLGGFSTIDEFVADKLKRFSESNKDFRTLFGFMFAESGNVMFERSAGYRIIKTTYGEVRRRILERAAVLSDIMADAERGSVIGLYLANSAEWLELFWAILACGFRPLLMNTRLGRDSLAQALDCVGAAAVIAGEDECFPVKMIPLSELEPGERAIEPESFGESLFVMSSGTSDRVKVCEYTGEEFYLAISDSTKIIAECPAIKKHYNGQLKLLAFLPFCHIFGLVAVYLWFGFFSRTFVLLKDYAPATIMDTIRRHEVTHIFAVPLFWNKVYEEAMKAIKSRGEATEAKFRKGMRISKKLAHAPALAKVFRKAAFREVRNGLFGDSISFLISGGSEIKPEVLEFFNGIGYHLTNGYGMTEIGITSVELSPKKKYLLGGSIGSPMSNAEYMIDESGELLVRGKVIARYVISGGEKREREGWYDTRDLAECEDGHYRLLGRRDDLIIGSGGENLNPNLIEPLLKTAGAELCLIPVSDNGHISPVLLAGVNRHLPAEKLEAIRAELTEKIHAAGLAGTISKVVLTGEELKKTDEFKLNRIRLSRDFSSGKIAPLDTSSKHGQSETDELVRHICELFSAFTKRPEEEISEESDFFIDLGGTSIDYFALLTRLRDEYSAAFPIDLNFHTPGQVAAYIREDAGGKSVR